MNQLKSMAAFVQIVEKGSLTAAASHLGLSAATMVRILAELEEHLGVRLLNRTTRRIALTDEGGEYLDHCRRILGEIHALEHRFDRRLAEPKGRLKVTAPIMFGQRHVRPLLTQWLKQMPAVSADLQLLDRPVDLLEEGVDIALRIGPLQDSSLIAIKLGELRYECCASPSLVEQLGMPTDPDDLNRWPALEFNRKPAPWAFNQGNQQWAVSPVARFSCNQIPPLLDAAVQGLGAVYVMSYQAAPYIAKGELVPLLRDYQTVAVPVHFVYPHRRLLTSRVRHFIDWAAPRLSEQLAQLGIGVEQPKAS